MLLLKYLWVPGYDQLLGPSKCMARLPMYLLRPDSFRGWIQTVELTIALEALLFL